MTISQMSNIQLSSFTKYLIVKLRCALYSIKYDYLTKHYGKESNSQGSLINLTKKIKAENASRSGRLSTVDFLTQLAPRKFNNNGSNDNQPHAEHPTFFLRQISHCKTKVRTVLDKIRLSDQTLWQGIQHLGKPN